MLSRHSRNHLTGEVQLVNYLNGMEKEIGLLINFAPNGVEVKRKYRQALAKR